MDEDRKVDQKHLSEFTLSANSDLPSIHVRFWQWLRLRGKSDLDTALNFMQRHDGGAFDHELVIKYLSKRGLLAFNGKSGTLHAKPWLVVPTRKRPPKKKPSEGVNKNSTLGKLTGRDQVLAAFENPRLAGSKEVIKDAVERTFRRVCAHRIKCNAATLASSNKVKNSRKWRSFTRKLVVEKAQTEDFLNFAFEKYDFLKGVEYPAIANLDGEWIWDEWGMRSTERQIKRKRHGGKDYAPPSVDLRERLVDAGFILVGEMDDSHIRYIESQAKTRAKHPTLSAGKVRDEWEPVVAWLTNDMKDDNGDS